MFNISSSLSDLEQELKYSQKTQSGKLLDLSSTIENVIKVLKPQLKLHFACISALPYSSIRENIRQGAAYEDNIQFEVISLGSASQIQMLVSEGIVSKLITSYVGSNFT